MEYRCFVLAVDTPQLPLRGTFSPEEKVAEGRMRARLAATFAENETAPAVSGLP